MKTTKEIRARIRERLHSGYMAVHSSMDILDDLDEALGEQDGLVQEVDRLKDELQHTVRLKEALKRDFIDLDAFARGRMLDLGASYPMMGGITYALEWLSQRARLAMDATPATAPEEACERGTPEAFGAVEASVRDTERPPPPPTEAASELCDQCSEPCEFLTRHRRLCRTHILDAFVGALTELSHLSGQADRLREDVRVQNEAKVAIAATLLEINRESTRRGELLQNAYAMLREVRANCDAAIEQRDAERRKRVEAETQRDAEREMRHTEGMATEALRAAFDAERKLRDAARQRVRELLVVLAEDVTIITDLKVQVASLKEQLAARIRPVAEGAAS